MATKTNTMRSVVMVIKYGDDGGGDDDDDNGHGHADVTMKPVPNITWVLKRITVVVTAAGTRKYMCTDPWCCFCSCCCCCCCCFSGFDSWMK